MMAIFDMGKYDFFVWGSIGVFTLALLVDFIFAHKQLKNTKKLIKAQAQRKQHRNKQDRSEQA